MKSVLQDSGKENAVFANYLACVFTAEKVGIEGEMERVLVVRLMQVTQQSCAQPRVLLSYPGLAESCVGTTDT